MTSQRRWRTLPIRRSCSGTALSCKRSTASARKMLAPSCLKMPRSSLVAEEGETPAASRPITLIGASALATRRTSGCVSVGILVAESAPAAGNRNPEGATPTMVTVVPVIVIVLPTIAGLPPNARCHSSWVRMATAGAPRSASLAAKSRPTTGVTPSSDRKFHVTSAASICCDTPEWTSVAARGPLNPAKSLSVRARSRQAPVTEAGARLKGLVSTRTSAPGSR